MATAHREEHDDRPSGYGLGNTTIGGRGLGHGGRIGPDARRQQSQPERANFTSASRLDLPLSFFRTVREGPRPAVEEWKETFAFRPRFQLLYAVDPEFPEMLLRAAASHHETKLKTAYRRYRRLDGLIGFFEKCQRAKLGVICEKGSA